MHNINSIQENANKSYNKVSFSTNETGNIKRINDFNCCKEVEPGKRSYTAGRSVNWSNDLGAQLTIAGMGASTLWPMY